MAALMVLGMHRSYTSLVARWLADCGLDLGDEVLPEGVGNVDGHFEDLDFFQLHVDVLRRHGLPSNGMVNLAQPSFDKTRYESLAIAGDLAERANALLATRLAKAPVFGWKEPRTCLFMPFYEHQADYRSLVLFRPYEEVVASLVSREPLAVRNYRYAGWRRPLYWLKKRQIDRSIPLLAAGFLEAWIHYNECLLDHIARTPPDRVMVHDLDSLRTNDAAVLKTLREWGFDCRERPFGVLVKPVSNREPLCLDPSAISRAEDVTARFRALVGK